MTRFYVLFLLLFSLLEANENYYNYIESIDLESLSKVKVYTSNRYETSVNEASSITTVVTSEEISLRGYKTLDELLSKVVGFYSGYDAKITNISNRGFKQSINSNYLILIDGHSLNENAYAGAGQYQIFPLIANIDRVEIIRGPGSVLWGTSALNGIISIITKNASDIDFIDKNKEKFSLASDYEIANKRSVLDMLYLKTWSDASFSLSAKRFDNHAKSGSIEGTDEHNYWLKQSTINHLNFEPSYMLYVRSTYNDFELNIGLNHFVHGANGYSSVDLSNSLNHISSIRDDIWIDAIHKKSINRFLDIKNKLSYNKKKRTLELIDNYNEIYEDENYGFESIANYNRYNNNLLVGITLNSKKLSANMQHDKSYDVLYPQTIDDTKAIFLENSFFGIDSWNFTLGGRMENSTFYVQDDNLLLVRASVYKKILDSWYLKYSYNTGSVKPTLLQTRGENLHHPYTGYSSIGWIKGADKIQDSYSHDFQVGYENSRFEIYTTLYYAEIKDLIIKAPKEGPYIVDGVNNTFLAETNLNDLIQKGLEIEFKYRYSDELLVYGNFSYADTHYKYRKLSYEVMTDFSKNEDMFDYIDIVDQRQVADDSLKMAGTPTYIYNLGFDWDIQSNLALNMHYLGYSDIDSKSVKYPDSFKNYGLKSFFDLNLRWRDDDIELSLYGKNLTDNRGVFPTGANEIVNKTGRQIGVYFKVFY